MTLKYESEILFDLMKRDGDDTPSDVLPYESELKEKYLHQVEGAYPKLQDYRSEWLNYNLNAHLPADFPVETLSNVTSATVDNVVPYAYGSAILKGKTLVNLSPFTNKIALTGLSASEIKKVFQTLNQNTKYILIFNINNSTSSSASNYIAVRGYNTDGTFKEYGRTIKNFGNGRHYILLESTEGNVDRIFIVSDFSCEIDDTILAIYQDGMENWDIPYFESMQSVKMPVLTTTGKNLFDKSTVKYNTTIQTYNDGQEVTDNNYMVSNFIEVKPNTTYTSNYMGVILYYDENRKFIGALDNAVLPQNLTTPNNCKYIRIRCWEQYNTIEKQREIVELEQLEENSVATTYEPYKTNILTVNEDVTLRGIGDVRDELNLLTGEVTERIGEIVLDGSEDWYQDNNGFTRFKTQVQNGCLDTSRSEIVSNFFPFISSINANSYPLAFIYGSYLYVYLEENTTVDSLKEWLKENKPTIHYKLETPAIKTVDLTVTNQDGNTTSIIRPIEGTMNVSTSSQTMPPLLDMSVPVEATSQNLMSFANIGEEE